MKLGERIKKTFRSLGSKVKNNWRPILGGVLAVGGGLLTNNLINNSIESRSDQQVNNYVDDELGDAFDSSSPWQYKW